MAEVSQHNLTLTTAPFGSIENPIQMMRQEHLVEGDRFEKIAQLTNHYNPPADACNTFKVCYAYLQEFEKDLHVHIHLENNILFPKAIEMQKQLQIPALNPNK